MDLKIIYTSFGDEDSAEQVAEKLVQEGLVACVNIFPKGRSVYIWKDKLQKESETYVVIKVAQDKLEKAVKRLKDLHPYSAPMITAVAAKSLNEEYSSWLL